MDRGARDTGGAGDASDAPTTQGPRFSRQEDTPLVLIQMRQDRHQFLRQALVIIHAA
jgi:hypothetical protein